MGDWPTDDEDWGALIEKEAALLENYWTRYDNVALIVAIFWSGYVVNRISCARSAFNSQVACVSASSQAAISYRSGNKLKIDENKTVSSAMGLRLLSSCNGYNNLIIISSSTIVPFESI